MEVPPMLMKCWLLVLSFLALAVPLAAQPDLAVQKSGPALVNQGSTIVYSVNVTNQGSSAATAITVTDPVPSGAVFSSVNQGSFICTAPPSGGGTVTCTLATLGAGQSAAFAVSLTLTGAGGTTVINTATAASNPADANPA